MFGVQGMGSSRPCFLIHFSPCTLGLGAPVLWDLCPHRQGCRRDRGFFGLWCPVSFLPISREMDCTGAGREWSDEDCPPRPGTFSKSDGICQEVGSHLERGLSRAYPSAPRRSGSCLPSSGMAPFSTQLRWVITQAPSASRHGAQPVPVFLLLMKDLFRSPLPSVHGTAD